MTFDVTDEEGPQMQRDAEADPCFLVCGSHFGAPNKALLEDGEKAV